MIGFAPPLFSTANGSSADDENYNADRTTYHLFVGRISNSIGIEGIFGNSGVGNYGLFLAKREPHMPDKTISFKFRNLAGEIKHFVIEDNKGLFGFSAAPEKKGYEGSVVDFVSVNSDGKPVQMFDTIELILKNLDGDQWKLLEILDLVSRACYFLNREKMEFANCETEENYKFCYDTYVSNCYDEYFNFSYEPGSELYDKALKTGTVFQFNPVLSHTCLHHWRICKNWCTMFQELIDDQDLKISP